MRTTRRRRSRAHRAAVRHLRDPWAPLTAREQWHHDRSRDREQTALINAGEVCAACGYPRGMPHCPQCPPDNEHHTRTTELTAQHDNRVTAHHEDQE